MHGTQWKHCSLIPPLVFNNNLALLKCGYMCAGKLVHISRHLSRMSNNNNKGYQLCIRCMLCWVCFHQILHRIFSLWPLLYYSCLHPPLLLVFYSTSLLLLSYHTMSIPCLIHLLYIYLLLYAYAHDTVFNACLWFGFIDARALDLARHLALVSPLAGVLTPLILMSRSQSL